MRVEKIEKKRRLEKERGNGLSTSKHLLSSQTSVLAVKKKEQEREKEGIRIEGEINENTLANCICLSTGRELEMERNKERERETEGERRDEQVAAIDGFLRYVFHRLKLAERERVERK